MSGIIVYAFLGGLIWIAVRISNWLVKSRGWVLSRNQLFFLQIGIVVGFLMILFGDLFIGVFQFEYICHQRTITKLEPGWQEVQRAHSKTAYVQSVSFSAVPISCAVSEFEDKDTGKLFFSYVSCSREGGFFIEKILGGDFSIGDSCYPKNLDSISDKINLRVLLEKGDEQ